MVSGLDVFRRHFEAYANRYILIGGTASDIALDRAGLAFRATKDLDIVLCVEALDTEFTTAFWAFVRNGRYSNRQKSTGRRLFYRFYDPEDESFPAMLELFSRTPDALDLPEDAHLTPIPVSEVVSSLSAILLDDDYYALVQAGKEVIDGLAVATPECLIPLKAHAWLNLSSRRAAGEKVDERDVRKHRNDVFRLYQVVDPEPKITLPDTVRTSMMRFIALMEEEQAVDLKNLGLQGTTLRDVLVDLRRVYGLDR
jgi:hypothetical protein